MCFSPWRLSLRPCRAPWFTLHLRVAFFLLGKILSPLVFTPTDQTDFTGATASVLELVNPANPTTLIWPTPAPITYETALSSIQLNATAQTTPGTTSVSLASYYRVNAFQTDGSLFSTGGFDNAGQAFSSNALTTNYITVTKTVQLTVNKATPVITWGPPAAITYGTALSATQLNATASVPGRFCIHPRCRSYPQRRHPTLSVTFAPTDTTNYTAVTQTVSLTVNKATLTVGAANASRAYNTANPIFTGTVTGAVNGDVFTESFTTTAILSSPVGPYPITPSAAGANLANYAVAINPGTLTVTQATPVVTWNNPTAMTYGTPLSATQLNATASVPGSFAYTPAVGVILNAGTQTLSVTFTPTDTTDYTTVTQTVSLTVTKASPVIIWNNPAAITYGAALSTIQLNATATVGGSFAYTPAAGTILNAGPQPSQSPLPQPTPPTIQQPQRPFLSPSPRRR
jgi:hypothetical protein